MGYYKVWLQLNWQKKVAIAPTSSCNTEIMDRSVE